MINLFSIYKKALLIPRSGLGELPDTTLFGLIIYLNDLQLSSHAFPEHNRNQLLTNEVSESQGWSCGFWDLGQGWSPRQQEIMLAENLLLMVTPAVLSRANERGQKCVCTPTKTCEDTMQGQAHAASCCPGLPMATGSSSCEYVTYAHPDISQWRPQSFQGLLSLFRLLS